MHAASARQTSDDRSETDRGTRSSRTRQTGSQYRAHRIGGNQTIYRRGPACEHVSAAASITYSTRKRLHRVPVICERNDESLQCARVRINIYSARAYGGDVYTSTTVTTRYCLSCDADELKNVPLQMGSLTFYYYHRYCATSIVLLKLCTEMYNLSTVRNRVH